MGAVALGPGSTRFTRLCLTRAARLLLSGDATLWPGVRSILGSVAAAAAATPRDAVRKASAAFANFGGSTGRLGGDCVRGALGGNRPFFRWGFAFQTGFGGFLFAGFLAGRFVHQRFAQDH